LKTLIQISYLFNILALAMRLLLRAGNNVKADGLNINLSILISTV